MKTKKKFNGKRSKSSYRKENPAKSDIKVCENDISWYTRYPSLIGPNASIIYNTRYGHKYLTVDGVTTTATNQRTATSVSGIVKINYMPMYADSAADSSAVNVASKNLYTYVRHANSGSVNYESSDLMQYLITIMNLYVHVEQCKRDIRIANTYSAVNKYVGINTLTALRSAAYAADVVQNNATYVGYLNTVIAKLNSLKFPKDIAILDRHLWLSSNIFRDDDLTKFTQYVFDTSNIAHYDWSNREVDISNVTRTNLGVYIAQINSEIDNLLAYEDIGIMIGDMLKAYKAEGCRIMAPIQLGEILDTVKSDEVLMQLRNLTVFPTAQPSFDNYTIKQLSANTQIIYAQQSGYTGTDGKFTFVTNKIGTPYATGTAIYKPTLIIDADAPSPEEVILATRFSLSGELTYGSSGSVSVKDYASEILTAMDIYNFQSSSYGAEETLLSTNSFYSYSQVGNSVSVDDLFVNLTGINQLHKATGSAPYSLLFNYGNSTTNSVKITNYYNGKNVQLIEPVWLARLHEACKLSLWTMPMFKLLETN